jgi:hypothetical protein
MSRTLVSWPCNRKRQADDHTQRTIAHRNVKEWRKLRGCPGPPRGVARTDRVLPLVSAADTGYAQPCSDCVKLTTPSFPHSFAAQTHSVQVSIYQPAPHRQPIRPKEYSNSQVVGVRQVRVSDALENIPVLPVRTILPPRWPCSWGWRTTWWMPRSGAS